MADGGRVVTRRTRATVPAITVRATAAVTKPFAHVDVLGVYAWGERVGALASSTRARDTFVFQYDRDWARGARHLAPLLMPHKDSDGRERDTWTFPTSTFNEVTFKGLPPMIADAMPDAFGNTLIDAALREGGITGQPTALDRLAYMGERTMGALTFKPAAPVGQQMTSIDLKTLVEAARSAVDGDISTEESTHTALQALLQVGTSAGGARAKAVVAWNRETDELRAGNLGRVDGFEQWILKFDGVGKRTEASTGQEWGDPQGYTRIERAYYLMAEQAGLTVPETCLLEENGRGHFMIRRFDRTDTDERLHMQTLCGLTGLDFNVMPDQYGHGNRYEDLFDTLARMGLDDDDTKTEVLRRMVFNVLASNNDDHTKNFAFLMNAIGRWSLAPAYDLTFSYRADSEWVSQHLMSVNGKRDHITRADVMELADKYEIPGAAAVIRDVTAAVARWAQHAVKAGVSSGHLVEVGKRLGIVTADFIR